MNSTLRKSSGSPVKRISLTLGSDRSTHIKPLKILVISFMFPPYNRIGAVRNGKTVKHLTEMGHDIKVISANNQPCQKTLPLEIPDENVIYTNWLNIRKPVELIMGGRKKVINQPNIRKGAVKSILKKTIYRAYKSLLYIPDEQIGWYPFALNAAANVLTDWKPDLIFASGTPFTSLMAAKTLSVRYKIPWIAELRDLWADNHYNDYYKFRKIIEKKLEAKTLSNVSGLVTVSEPLAEILAEKYNKPTTVIMNGYSPEDYPELTGNRLNEKHLNIVYTGLIYEGKRDPTPLFKALQSLGDAAKNVRVHFYGRALSIAGRLAQQYGIDHLVKTNDPIPYKESLSIQKQADILLLLLWDDPREKGVYTGKLFEYIGAERPVLAIGRPDNIAAQLIKNRKLGETIQNPNQIASRLKQWIEEKQRNNMIRPVPIKAKKGLSRKEQSEKLEAFFLKVITGEKPK